MDSRARVRASSSSGIFKPGAGSNFAHAQHERPPGIQTRLRIIIRKGTSWEIRYFIKVTRYPLPLPLFFIKKSLTRYRYRCTNKSGDSPNSTKSTVS